MVLLQLLLQQFVAVLTVLGLRLIFIEIAVKAVKAVAVVALVNNANVVSVVLVVVVVFVVVSFKTLEVSNSSNPIFVL